MSISISTTVRQPRWAVVSLAVFLLAWPMASLADEFVNLRFYPGQEPVREGRPSKEAPITLSFSGKLYDTAESRFSSDRRLDPDEEFILKVEEVNREGSKEDILELWDPKERAELAQDLDDAEAFTRNRTGYQSIKESAFVLKANYGAYTLFLVQNINDLLGPQMQIYPIRRTSNGYVLTNKLADDPILEFLYYFYRERMQPLDDPTAGVSGAN